MILREADRSTVAEAAKKHKVSDSTIYAWRKHFGQMKAADVKRLKTLELENRRFKKTAVRNYGGNITIQKRVSIPSFQNRR